MKPVLITHDLHQALFISDHLESEGYRCTFSSEAMIASLVLPYNLPIPSFTLTVNDDEAEDARQEINWLLSGQ